MLGVREAAAVGPELGVAYFDQLERQRVEQRLVRRLERLGYTVNLAAPASEPMVAA